MPDTTSAADASADRGLVERLLSPIAEVRKGETLSVLLMTLTMFLILAAYYQLKTAREIFILSEGGAEVKSYSSAGQAILLLGLVPAYGAFASRVNRGQLVTWVTLFFISNIVLFILALQAGLKIGIVYFLWVGIFNLMVIAQFWALANDLYTKEQGKRLFPLIGVGSSLGAWLGSLRSGNLLEHWGPTRLLVGAASILTIVVVLSRVIDHVSRSGASAAAAKEADAPIAGGQSGFGMILSDRYLMLIALLTVVLNVVNTSGEYLFGRYVVEAANARFVGPENDAARQQFIGATYSSFFSAVNLAGFLMQAVVVSRVFKFLGVGKALFIHPIVALAGYTMMLRAPSLEAIRWFKVADNSIDYSLGNTTKQALWLPTSREAKYKAKQAVDSFCQRAGDVIQAGVVFAGERAALAVPGFALINIALTGAWLAVVAGLNHRLRRQAAESGSSAL